MRPQPRLERRDLLHTWPVIDYRLRGEDNLISQIYYCLFENRHPSPLRSVGIVHLQYGSCHSGIIHLAMFDTILL